MKLQQLNSIKLEKNNQTSFCGYKDAYRNDGKPVHQFFAPNYDKSKYDVHLEFISLKNTDNQWEAEKNDLVEFENAKTPFRENQPVNLPKDIENLLNTKQFGYRFVFTPIDSPDDKFYYNDPGTLTQNSVNGGKFTVMINGIGGVAKAGPMYHAFVDSYNLKEEAKENFGVRTHFNVAGGNIKGLINKVVEKDGELKPYKLLMTTPLFGKDEISSHGYWTTNPFQISSMKGNLDDFKKLNVELFKAGKQFVADGAFTSQGFESPFLQHALKWGTESPYYNWFKFDYTSPQYGSKILLGVLPSLSNPHDEKGVKKQLSNISHRIVNNPHSDNYDAKKPTFIQFYDNRLVDSKQLERADINNELIKTYDVKNPKDSYDIYGHQGSVQPYAFEVALSSENLKKIKALSNVAGKPLSEIDNYAGKLEFDNFVIAHKSRNGGANFWDGQLDLVKLNLSNPNIENELGSTQAKNSLFNAASYWTKTTHDALLSALATDPENIEEVAKTNGITDFAKINPAKYQNNLFKDKFDAKQFILNEVANFPLETIEVAPNLTAVLASQYISPSAAKDSQLNASRMELLNNTKSRDVYNNVAAFVKDVLSKMDATAGQGKKIFQNDNLTEYGRFVARIITPELTKYAFVNAMFPDQVSANSGEINYKESLKNKGILDLSIKETSCANEAGKLISKLKSGTSSLNASSDKLAKIFEKRFEKADLNSFKLAQAVIEQSGAGLNWRFDAAKDVADLDTMRSNPSGYNADNAVNNMIDFWKPFVSNIKKENPNSLTIAEITNFFELFARGKDTDKDGAAIGERANNAERKFYEQTGATTGSNYAHLFSIFPKLYGHCVEHGTNDSANMEWLWGSVSGFLSSGTLPFVLNSHIFADNHDKPRVLHSMALDNGLFLSNFKDESHKSQARQIVGDDVDLDSISSKAVAVAEAYKKSFDKVVKNDVQREKMNEALLEFTLGVTKGGSIPNKGRSEAFGFRPFEVTINDVIKRADLKLDPAEQKKLADSILVDVTRTGREKLVNMWEVMSAIAGVPTLFAGTEFSQTGYETPCKNVELGCRGVVLHNRASEKNEFAKTYQDIRAISDLHNENGLSALSGGVPILLDKNKTDDGKVFFPLYKYDDKGSEVISVFADTGANDDRSNLSHSPKGVSATVEEIRLQSMPGNAEFSSIIETGTEYGRKILKNGKYKDDGVKYIINDQGNLVAQDGTKIALNAGANFFYRKG